MSGTPRWLLAWGVLCCQNKRQKYAKSGNYVKEEYRRGRQCMHYMRSECRAKNGTRPTLSLWRDLNNAGLLAESGSCRVQEILRERHISISCFAKQTSSSSLVIDDFAEAKKLNGTRN